MGIFSDWIHYNKTTGTKTMSTGQKNTFHNAYKRYALRKSDYKVEVNKYGDMGLHKK